MTPKTETFPERTWTFVDRSNWPEPDGQWMDEPDKVQWVDEATGLDCLIHRGPSGALCGYVGLPPGHVFHGKDYNAVMFDDEYPDAHGGLTFADSCGTQREDGGGVCHIPYPGRPDDVWWLGFDCAHSGDHCPGYERFGGYGSYRTIDYVKRNCAVLAKQLASAQS